MHTLKELNNKLEKILEILENLESIEKAISKSNISNKYEILSTLRASMIELYNLALEINEDFWES